MKNTFTTMLVLIALLLGVLLNSCSTSHDVISKGWIQKRKYTKGYFVENSHQGRPENPVKAETISSNLGNAQIDTPDTAWIQTNVVTTPAETHAINASLKEKSNTSSDYFSENETSPKDGALIPAKSSKKTQSHIALIENKRHNGKEDRLTSNAEHRDSYYDANTALDPMGTTTDKKKSKYLAKLILSSIFAAGLYIAALVVAKGSVIALSTYTIPALLLIASYIFMFAAFIYFIGYLFELIERA